VLWRLVGRHNAFGSRYQSPAAAIGGRDDTLVGCCKQRPLGSALFSGDGRRVVTASEDKTARI
jgi:hypothetical protein